MVAIGDCLLGKLRVVRELGQGGAGRVFEVCHEITRHRRALKVLRSEHRADDEMVRRLIREASAASRIGNSHIVETFDAGFLPDGAAFLLMELVDGVPLRDRLRAGVRLKTTEAADIAIQCCEAFEAVHAAGIVHRDLKPDNLLLTGTGRRPFLKVLDFGIAHFDDTQSRPQGLLGTPLYMAPEQITGGDIDGRTDIYALGRILFEMVAGSLPGWRQPIGTFLEAVVNGQHARVREVAPDVPQELDELIAQCTAPNPIDRFATMSELRDKLLPWRAVGRENDGLDDTFVRPRVEDRGRSVARFTKASRGSRRWTSRMAITVGPPLVAAAIVSLLGVSAVHARSAAQPLAKITMTTSERVPVEFRIRPFGDVWVDGEYVDETPFDATPLTVGWHTVRIVNKELGREVTRALEVRKNDSNIVRLNFNDVREGVTSR